jgi:hypothetical protein
MRHRSHEARDKERLLARVSRYSLLCYAMQRGIMRQKIRVMVLAGPETRNDCAGEGQLHVDRRPEKILAPLPES